MVFGEKIVVKSPSPTPSATVVGKGQNLNITKESGHVLSLAKPGPQKVLQLPQRIRGTNLSRADKKMIIHTHREGHVWKPLNTYTVTWEAFKKFPKSGYAFNVKLISADKTPFTPIVLKKNYWYVSKHTPNSYIFTITWKFLGSMNIPSGKYKLLIKSISIAELREKSGQITVENTISSGTGFIGGDDPDFKVEDVYYDVWKKSVWVRIKNQGFSYYKGPLTIQYNFTIGAVTFKGSKCSHGTMKNKVEFKQITLNKFQSKAFEICKWTCFDKRPADYLPQTGPVKYSVFVYASGKKAVGKNGIFCKCKKPDIIISDPIRLIGKFDPVYLWGFKQQNINPNSFNWISKNTFTARVGVNVRNWGCQGKQFKIKLYADGNFLDGAKEVTLGMIHLTSGKEIYFTSKTVKFSIPKDNKYHRLLLVAHPAEIRQAGYPNAYKNNFIITHIRLKTSSNTVRGVVDFD